MRFKKVSENKLQIIMNRDDLTERNLVKWDMLPHNSSTQKIFQEILEEAYDACGFEVENNTQLMIEAFPITGESMIINVTKIDGNNVRNLLEEELAGISAKLLDELQGSDGDEEEEYEKSFVDGVYCFRSLDDVIDLSVQLKEQYEGESILYKYDEQYFLHLINLQEDEQEIMGVLSEYGNLVSLAKEFLKEHGEIVIEKDALQYLALVG